MATYTGMDVKRHGLLTAVPKTKAAAKAWLKALAYSPLAFHLDDPTEDIPSFTLIAARRLGERRDAAVDLLGNRRAWSYYDWHLTKAQKLPPKTNPSARTPLWTKHPDLPAYIQVLPDHTALEVVKDDEYGWIASINGVDLNRPFKTLAEAKRAVVRAGHSKRNPLPPQIAAALKQVGKPSRRRTTKRNPPRLGLNDPAVQAALRDAAAWKKRK
jgi:hypothetical protein